MIHKSVSSSQDWEGLFAIAYMDIMKGVTCVSCIHGIAPPKGTRSGWIRMTWPQQITTLKWQFLCTSVVL